MDVPHSLNVMMSLKKLDWSHGGLIPDLLNKVNNSDPVYQISAYFITVHLSVI